MIRVFAATAAGWALWAVVLTALIAVVVAYNDTDW